VGESLRHSSQQTLARSSRRSHARSLLRTELLPPCRLCHSSTFRLGRPVHVLYVLCSMYSTYSIPSPSSPPVANQSRAAPCTEPPPDLPGARTKGETTDHPFGPLVQSECCACRRAFADLPSPKPVPPPQPASGRHAISCLHGSASAPPKCGSSLASRARVYLTLPYVCVRLGARRVPPEAAACTAWYRDSRLDAVSHGPGTTRRHAKPTYP
jgi:hypothetical protein